MNTLYVKLGKVQKELKAPKNQYNSFGRYNYRSCEDILSAAKPLCVDNGLVLTVSDSIELVGDRFYIKATATVADMETGEIITNTAYAREEAEKKGMDGSQITGTASSYARKYALNGLFCIDDTKDADTEEYHEQVNRPVTKPQQKPQPAPQPVQPEPSVIDPDALFKEYQSVLASVKQKQGGTLREAQVTDLKPAAPSIKAKDPDALKWAIDYLKKV